jgi:hypothetical protein
LVADTSMAGQEAGKYEAFLKTTVKVDYTITEKVK